MSAALHLGIFDQPSGWKIKSRADARPFLLHWVVDFIKIQFVVKKGA
jgi:hypothetical protein